MARLIVKASTGAAAPEATPIAHGDSCSMRRPLAVSSAGGDEFMVSWSSQEAVQAYGVPYSRRSLFSISAEGQVSVHPSGDEACVGLADLVHDLTAQGARPDHPPLPADHSITGCTRYGAAFARAIEAALSRRLPRRLPDQGQSAALRGACGARRWGTARRRPRGWLQARAHDRHGDAKGGRINPVQWLQGCRVPQDCASTRKRSGST